MNLRVAGNSSTVFFWILAFVASGLIARPLIHWAFDQLAKILETLEPSEREGADLELYRACSLLDSMNEFAWIACGPFLLPYAIWGVWMVIEAKCFDREKPTEERMN